MTRTRLWYMEACHGDSYGAARGMQMMMMMMMNMWCICCYLTVTCRYLFALQVKRDLSTGALPCHEHTAIMLASYVVQCQYITSLASGSQKRSLCSLINILSIWSHMTFCIHISLLNAYSLHFFISTFSVLSSAFDSVGWAKAMAFSVLWLLMFGEVAQLGITSEKQPL